MKTILIVHNISLYDATLLAIYYVYSSMHAIVKTRNALLLLHCAFHGFIFLRREAV